MTGLKNATKVSPRGVWVAVLIVVMAFGIQLFLSTIIVEDAYRTSELEQQHLELERAHTAALEKSDAQDSPQYLAAQATDLGMVPASSSAFLDLESQSIVHGEGWVPEREKVDASLVPNAVLEPAEEEQPAPKPGESTKKKEEPAVPSEFEMSSPSTR
ncbi:hypothetical protein C7K25_03225 [Gulosibacter molinativorax]|uniref:Cell division protein FtsL n=1 Tax=Gulosibacter molinativorax TaxID=256821 RepID=A0ABT7C5C3_9MICO|nr:hypothetical protein [Gulosibacter molinativorax]